MSVTQELEVKMQETSTFLESASTSRLKKKKAEVDRLHNMVADVQHLVHADPKCTWWETKLVAAKQLWIDHIQQRNHML